MGSWPKRQKLHGQAKAGEAVDRISNLPDSILCHILSFLPTEDAVRTSIFSTRWKYLFASSPNLDFDYSSFFPPEEDNGNLVGKDAFVNFVYRVLVLRNTLNINRFRLKCYVKHDSRHVSAWICAALCHNVKELDLEIFVAESYVLLCDLFACRTLVVLRLDMSCDLSVPTKVCFPNLKSLHLEYVVFVDEDSIKRLFSGCFVLEDLHICNCELYNLRVLDISISTLKRLTLQTDGVADNDRTNFKLVIDAPCLEYLNYTDHLAEDCTLKNLSSLVKVYIDVIVPKYHQNSCYGRQVINLFEGISNVDFLYLSGDFMLALDVTQCCLPTLPNLTLLELGSFNVDRGELLPRILESSPNLQVLIFPKGIHDKRFKRFELCLPEHVPSCLSLHLEVIEIREFTGKEDELKLVEYFLKNAKVLEKMAIRCCMCLMRELDISEKLLMFQRH